MLEQTAMGSHLYRVVHFPPRFTAVQEKSSGRAER
jgi:hypothetical protein